jgi:hypothetical protein
MDGRISIVKKPVLPKQYVDSMTSLSKPQVFFTEIGKLILKLTWNHKDPK